jgi:hypothetical protein
MLKLLYYVLYRNLNEWKFVYSKNFVYFYLNLKAIINTSNKIKKCFQRYGLSTVIPFKVGNSF